MAATDPNEKRTLLTLTVTFDISTHVEPDVAEQVKSVLQGWINSSVKELLEESLEEQTADLEFDPDEPVGVAMEQENLSIEVKSAE